MKSWCVFILLLVANAAFGQQGNYFLSHYTPTDERVNYTTFDIAQDAKGVIYYANKNGVLEFDGRNWNMVPAQGPVFTITSSGNEIFAGGYNGFGKLVIGEDNTKSYQSLSEKQPNSSQIFSSLASDGNIYFLNDHSVFVFSISANTVIATIKAKPNEEFMGLFEIIGKPYVKSSNGIFKITDKQIEPANFPWTDNLSIEFSTTLPSSNLTLLGVAGGRLFLATASGLREINVTDHDYLIHNGPIGAAWVSDKLIAVGTLRGGVIFINPQTGATEEVTNFYTGLPDNEVLALLVDRNQGLWVAHEYGFSRVAPYLPFRSFSHYPGLNGNLLCAKTFQGQTYVGTTIGLYSLIRKEVYDDISVEQPTTKPAESKAKKGLFSFLKRNKIETASSSAKSVRKVLRSIGYEYKKVEGIDGKVGQLLETNGQLLASGTFGLASVNGMKSSSIVRTPMRSVYKSETLQQLFASTADDEVKTFAATGNTWRESHLLDTLNEYVSYIFEDKLQNIWLCGRTEMLKVETVDGEITAVEQVPFKNPTIDESVGLAYGSEVYVATGGSFHRYDIKDNIFKKYDSLPGPKKYFASAGYFWFHDGHRWRTVDRNVQRALNLEWLGLFSNIRFIAPAEKGTLWVITAENELYKFSGSQATKSQSGYPLFLREVRGQQSKFTPSHSIKISQLETTVAFEFIQPDYLGMKAIEYHYRVNGISSDWSMWSSTNNIVNFSFLPAGKYKVEVETRDLMGTTTKAEPITLEIEPPYWKKPWFYLVEVLFFGSLVFLSIRLSSGNAKYRLLSQLLSMLTVIMLIQLIQTSVSSMISMKTTPVIDFFLQVGIALLVLPVENTLRKYILK
jgi:hypothetical protein